MRNMEEDRFLESSHLRNYLLIDGSIYSSKGIDPSRDSSKREEHNLQPVGLVLPLYGNAWHHIEEREVDSWQVLQFI